MRFPATAGIGLLSTALVSVVPVPALGQELPSASQIVERYIEAVGGRAAFERHQFRRSEIESSMPSAGLTMEVEVLQARPDLTLSRVTIPGAGTMTSGYDGEVAWSRDPMRGVRLLDGAELVQTRQQAHFDANLDFARIFPTMETMERTTMGDRPCYQVRMVTEDGVEVRNCFDTESGLLIGALVEQTSATGTTTAELLFEDYRDVDGILMPMRTRVSTMGQVMVMTVKAVSHEPIDPAVFELPADVRALLN